LSPKSPVGYIDIRVFAHATEDTDKVLLSAHHTLPSELKEVVKFKETRLTGYYKNPIILYQTRLTDKQTFIPILKTKKTLPIISKFTWIKEISILDLINRQHTLIR